jgi:Zn-dependent protease
VWIDRSAIRDRTALSVVSAAGPLTNLVLAVVLLYPLGAGWIDPAGRVFFATGLAWLGVLQIAAAFLNLLPVPGLDGYGIVEPYLPLDLRVRLAPIAGWSLIIVFFLLWRIDALNQFFWDRVFGLSDTLGVSAIFPVCGQFTFEFWDPLPRACAA